MNKTKLIAIALDLIKCLKEQQTARGGQILDLKKKQITLEQSLRDCLNEKEAPSELKEIKEGPKDKEVKDGPKDQEGLGAPEVNSSEGPSDQKDKKEIKETKPKVTKGDQIKSTKSK